MQLEIKYKPLADLIPYARNSRTHSEAQVKQIASSIKEFGFVNPILISTGNDIVAGHGRALAAEKLGLELVPTIELGHLSDTQRRAYVIADNRLAELSGWDMEILSLEINQLKEDLFEDSLVGFSFNDFSSEEFDESILEDDSLKDDAETLKDGTRKSIQIEFEQDDYQEAYDLISWWRKKGAYVGSLIVQHLKKEKEKAE